MYNMGNRKGNFSDNIGIVFHPKKRWAFCKNAEVSCSELAEYDRYFVNNVRANSVGIIWKILNILFN